MNYPISKYITSESSNNSSSEMVANLNLPKSIDKNNMDLSINPGEDFALYATGNLIKKYTLRDDQKQNGVLVALLERNQKRIQGIILEFANNSQKDNSVDQKISILYNQKMDIKNRNNSDFAPIVKYLEQIKAVKNIDEYLKVTANMKTYDICELMFNITVSPDECNTEQNIVKLHQGGLGLGLRDYYLNDDPQTIKIREAYKELGNKLFQLIGYTSENAKKKMNAVFAIEKRLAIPSYSKVRLRDKANNYHKIQYKELLDQYSGINWNIIFDEFEFPEFDFIDVKHPEPIHEVEKILSETSLEDLKSYSEFKILTGAANSLSENFQKAAFEFTKIQNGQQEDDPMWKQATNLVNNVFGEAIGKKYCEKYFPESSKTKMLILVKNLQKAFADRIKSNKWMSEKTKKEALKKLDKFSVKIGYPDNWLDYSDLEIKESNSLYENLINTNKFIWNHKVKNRVNKPVDKTEWALPPQTLNAYYSPTSNEICFPAGILQAPLFDPEADEALNYGSIGVVIGHEMSHGFDDKGSLYDLNGNLKDWWTKEDRESYENRIKTIEEHFSQIEVINGKKINGKQTLGENIADNVGIIVSLQAFHNVSNNKIIDDLTPDQRFFLAYTRNWASNARPEYLEALITNDVHSPMKARVNGALPHIDAWYEAFGIKEGDKLYIPKEKRADVW